MSMKACKTNAIECIVIFLRAWEGIVRFQKLVCRKTNLFNIVRFLCACFVEGHSKFLSKLREKHKHENERSRKKWMKKL